MSSKGKKSKKKTQEKILEKAPPSPSAPEIDDTMLNQMKEFSEMEDLSADEMQELQEAMADSMPSTAPPIDVSPTLSNEAPPATAGIPEVTVSDSGSAVPATVVLGTTIPGTPVTETAATGPAAPGPSAPGPSTLGPVTPGVPTQGTPNIPNAPAGTPEGVPHGVTVTPIPGAPGAPVAEEIKPEFRPDIGAELEAKIQAELARKKKTQGVKTVTKEDFVAYLAQRKSKIVYHALWYLAFKLDDHEASKKGLYDGLKEVTSKSATEPIDEHKFYFGLGFILRLKLFDQPVVQYIKGKLKLTVNIENLQEILKTVGEPISERPILTKDAKDKMFADFLGDDFKDI